MCETQWGNDIKSQKGNNTHVEEEMEEWGMKMKVEERKEWVIEENEYDHRILYVNIEMS